MATGYLVTLGDSSLDDGDFITASQSTFTIDSNIGTGSWTWSGSYIANNGKTRTQTDYTDTGTYYVGSDGNVYFIPDNLQPISGSGTAVNPPTYFALDGTVSGTAGDDVIDADYTGDPDTDVVDGGDFEGSDRDIIEAGAGNDSINAGNADDTVFGGTGNDTIEGGLGADSIDGGDGNDLIFGDGDGAIAVETTQFQWDAQSIADETSVTGGVTGNTANGDIQVAMTITQEENFTGASMETNDVLFDYNSLSDTSSIELYGGATGTGQNASTMTMDFSSNDPTNISDEVMDVTFGIFDLDEFAGQFIDQVIITAFDADGNPVAVTLTAGNASTISVDNATGTATAIGGSGGAGDVDSQTGFVQISVAGPVAKIVIDYNNIDTAYGNHAIRVGDLELTTIAYEDPALSGDTIDGGLGDDEIYGGVGDDSMTGGDGADTVYGGDGADIVGGGAGTDTLFGGDGNDTISGGSDDDSVSGGDGDDTVMLDSGNDTFGAFGTEAGNDTVYGGSGDDSINGGAGNDALYGGSDNDTITGGTGDDTLYGGTGSDEFQITDDHDGDIIFGGEDGDGSDVDTIVFAENVSDQGITVTATGDEAGTYNFNGTSGTGSYQEIEGFISQEGDDTFNLGADNSGVLVDTFAGDDSITTGAGDDTILAGEGADTINAGAGNDSIDLGQDSPGNPDQDPDVIVLEDGFGDDVVTNFDAPTPNGDGTFTGIDTLDVTNLLDAGGDPVLTNDVVVTDDGFGNALLTFPNGETLLLDGISPTDANNPFYLNAIGIPMPDGTVEGTAGNDVIDGSYTGDPDGDMVDAGDAILAGDTGNDDLIYGYGGNDSITAGAGDDEVYGGTGDDTIQSDSGDNTLYGGTGNDTVIGGTGNDDMFGGDGSDTFTISQGGGTDTIVGGEDVSGTDVDTLNFEDTNGIDGVNVTMTADEAGTYIYPTDGGSGTFSEIEKLDLSDQNDVFDGAAATGGNTVDGGAGDDTIYGGVGADSIDGGADNDVVDGGDGNDTIEGGSGDDTLTGGAGNDTVFGGADQDVIYGGPGDVVDGGSAGTDNDTLIVSNVDYIDYDTDPENGIVYFNGGGTLTFTDIENVIVSDRDGTVSGTAGDDLINNAYVGDPDGDRVDNTDAILPGDAPNDDLIEAGAGNDTIYAGLGDDEIYAGTGNDTVVAGSGNDTVFGGTGDDIINGGAGNDSLYGGDDDDRFVLETGFGTDTIEGGEGGTDNDEIWSTTSADVTVSVTGDEAGSITDGISTANFIEIESIETEDGNDTINLSGDSTGMDVDSGAGNDTITGGTGDDSIIAGSGNDTVFANAGNNTIALGIGDDVVTLGTGDDTVFGGTGSDTFNVDDASGTNTVVGGEGNGGISGDILNSTSAQDVTVTTVGDEAGTLTTGTTTVNFTQIETIQTGAGNDSVDLTNDTSGMDVSTGAGNDTLRGGSGDDTLDGGTGSDTFIIDEGFGNDTLSAGEDVGGADVDVVDAGGMTSDVTLNFTGPEAGTLSDGINTATFTDVELFALGAGNDTVIGGDGDELVFAGAGDDTMTGGRGADTFYSGTGNDDITFSEGDTMFGGSGDDSFTLEDLGEASNGTITIDGGGGTETGGDTLKLGSLGNLTQAVRDTFVDDGTGSFSGSITLDDGTILNFSEIENIICFTPNTRIATPKGLVPIQDLEVGDLVVTRDHGLQPIRWIEGRTVPGMDRFAPVRIRKNVLSGQDRDLIVSPQHRVLFQGYRAELLFGESEVLVAATHLVDGMDVTQDESAMVTYVHMLFDQHEIIYAEGAATESFHPGDIGFSAVGAEAREELFTIFPELRVDPRTYGSTARRCLKSHEAKLIRT